MQSPKPTCAVKWLSPVYDETWAHLGQEHLQLSEASCSLAVVETKLWGFF